MPCDPLDDGAAYEMSFKMPEAKAKELFKAMKAFYDFKKEKSWPDKFPLPFKKDDDGMYIGKCKLKGAYGTDKTRKPQQFDAKNNELDADFKLTSGSTVNIAVTFVPYSMRDSGVSLRINGVQVTKYEPMTASSPFGVVEGGFEMAAQNASPFADTTTSTSVDLVEDDSDDIFGDEPDTSVVEEPKKVVKKSAPAPKDDDDLSSVIEDWDD
tara:strand:+ start:11 stop:643 length:633 start_codon:yes stop_codon:yes gene_type:complete